MFGSDGVTLRAPVDLVAHSDPLLGYIRSTVCCYQLMLDVIMYRAIAATGYSD